jgi:hypothetical protein
MGAMPRDQRVSCACAVGCNPNVNASAAIANTVLILQTMMISPFGFVFGEHPEALNSHGR